MKILVLNGSPSGKNSITLQTVLFIEQYCKKASFEILDVGQKIRSFEKDFSGAAASLREADLVLFCYPVYTFLVPAQLHRFIELIKENGVDLRGKYASQITTSKHFYDVTAHQFIQDNCDDLGMRYIRGLSADMEDLLGKKGQKEALSFFRHVLWSMKEGLYEPHRYAMSVSAAKAPGIDEAGYDGEREAGARTEHDGQREAGARTEHDGQREADTCTEQDAQAAGGTDAGSAGRVAIVADILPGEEGAGLREMIRKLRQESRMTCEVFNIREFPFRGGCLGCFHCAADGTCIYKDGFDQWLRDGIQKADAIVYAYAVRDHSMGSRFKTFDDRQFCNGHRTVTMGKPVGYLVDGCLDREENLRMVMEARAQVGGNYPAGIACSSCAANLREPDSGETDRQIRMLAETLEFTVRNHYSQPKNFYGVGGLKIFRDLIYQMQGLMREDHRFYKEHGFYDFPQKRKGMIAAMYLVGSMMNDPKLKKKLGGKMTEGMLMPYQKVLEDHEKRLSHVFTEKT